MSKNRRSLGERSRELFGSENFLQRVGAAAGLTIGVILLLMLVWYVMDVVILILAGVLLAILFSTLASWLQKATHLPYSVSLGAVLLLIIGSFGLLGWYLAPQISAQFNQLSQQLPQAIARVGGSVMQNGWGAEAVSRFTAGDVLDGAPQRAFSIFGNVVSALASMLLVLVLGIYLAINPASYRRGIVQLVPVDKRPRAEEVLDALHASLLRWLLGTFIAMLIIGLITGIALWLLDVPLALLFGVLAGLLEFVPVIGPIVASIPAILLALLISPQLALYVLLLYVAIQQLESYLIAPVIYKHTVYLPPALLLLTQVLFGVLFGFLGVMFATPMLIVLIVLVKMLYIEDVLGDETEIIGRD